jgi:hypothetical protein
MDNAAVFNSNSDAVFPALASSAAGSAVEAGNCISIDRALYRATVTG